MLEILHLFFAAITAAIMIMAVFVARRSMLRGLTYSTMAAIIWLLIFFAASQLWHMIHDLWLETAVGDDLSELIEYALRVTAVAIFTILAHKSFVLRDDVLKK